MEKAILRTLIYADIFDYPLKAYEIHKWLIGQQATLWQVEKALNRLMVKGKAEKINDYYILPKRAGLIRKRKQREKHSGKFLLKAKLAGWLLRLIPTIYLVGLSGGLAVNNAEKSDDIDLFLVTYKNRIWLSRLLAISILDFMGIRRKAGMKEKEAAGKICTNILVEEDRLEQKSKDLFVAHEVLQMKVLWQRNMVYKKYLEQNNWVFKFLPNWINDGRFMIKDLRLKKKNRQSKILNHKSIFNYLEILARRFQLWYMKKPEGMERIEDGALYFHPSDIRQSVLKQYQQRLKRV